MPFNRSPGYSTNLYELSIHDTIVDKSSCNSSLVLHVCLEKTICGFFRVGRGGGWVGLWYVFLVWACVEFVCVLLVYIYSVSTNQQLHPAL